MTIPEPSSTVARAAAAAGVLAGMSPAAWRRAGAEPLLDALGNGPASWRLDLPNLADGLASTTELAERWLAAVKATPGPVRLRFDGVSDHRDNRWVELVRTRAEGIDGAYFPIR